MVSRIDVVGINGIAFHAQLSSIKARLNCCSAVYLYLYRKFISHWLHYALLSEILYLLQKSHCVSSTRFNVDVHSRSADQTLYINFYI